MFNAFPIHECIDWELDHDPTILTRLQEMIRDGELPPAYYQNPVVTNSEEPVLPVSLYLDAFPYADRDSVLGYWLVNEVTGRRHLLAPLRKNIMSMRLSEVVHVL